MIANYGYKDGSGTYFITVNTERCDGCGKCVRACPSAVLEIIENDFDPLGEGMMVAVTEGHRNSIKYKCATCKPLRGRTEPSCVKVCEGGAISHSW